jgi:hypothetical protein
MHLEDHVVGKIKRPTYDYSLMFLDGESAYWFDNMYQNRLSLQIFSDRDFVKFL